MLRRERKQSFRLSDPKSKLSAVKQSLVPFGRVQHRADTNPLIRSLQAARLRMARPCSAWHRSVSSGRNSVRLSDSQRIFDFVRHCEAKRRNAAPSKQRMESQSAYQIPRSRLGTARPREAKLPSAPSGSNSAFQFRFFLICNAKNTKAACSFALLSTAPQSEALPGARSDSRHSVSNGIPRFRFFIVISGLIED